MTVREWFRILRQEAWQKDPGFVMEVANIVTPAGFNDSINTRLPPAPAEHHYHGGRYGQGYSTFAFWRVWQPAADQEYRAHLFMRLTGIELADTKVNLIKQLMEKTLNGNS